MSTEAKCPFPHVAGVGRTNRDWWPNQLRLELLHRHSSQSDPMGGDFDYAKEFKSLDYRALKRDLVKLGLDQNVWACLPTGPPARVRGPVGRQGR